MERQTRSGALRKYGCFDKNRSKGESSDQLETYTYRSIEAVYKTMQLR